MAASTFSQNLLLSFLLLGTGTAPAAWYVALFSDDPGPDASNEVAAGDYARVAVVFTAPLAGASRNTVDLNLGPATSDWGVVSHWGIFDAMTTGHLLFSGPLDSSTTILEDDPVIIAAGSIEISLE